MSPDLWQFVTSVSTNYITACVILRPSQDTIHVKVIIFYINMKYEYGHVLLISEAGKAKENG